MELITASLMSHHLKQDSSTRRILTERLVVLCVGANRKRAGKPSPGSFSESEVNGLAGCSFPATKTMLEKCIHSLRLAAIRAKSFFVTPFPEGAFQFAVTLAAFHAQGIAIESGALISGSFLAGHNQQFYRDDSVLTRLKTQGIEL